MSIVHPTRNEVLAARQQIADGLLDEKDYWTQVQAKIEDLKKSLEILELEEKRLNRRNWQAAHADCQCHGDPHHIVHGGRTELPWE